jgi:hypothetical protein
MKSIHDFLAVTRALQADMRVFSPLLFHLQAHIVRDQLLHFSVHMNSPAGQPKRVSVCVSLCVCMCCCVGRGRFFSVLLFEVRGLCKSILAWG